MSRSEAFDRMLKKYRISGKWLASQSGTSEITISRFRKGKQTITTETEDAWMKVIPHEAREYYFSQVLAAPLTSLGSRPDWRSLIEQTEPQDIEEILRLLADHWSATKISKSTDRGKTPLTL